MFVFQGQLVDRGFVLCWSYDVDGVVPYFHLFTAGLGQLLVIIRPVVAILVINLEYGADILGQAVLGLHEDLAASPGAGSLGTYVVD